MYARVTSFHALPGTMDEGVRIFESLILQLKTLKGFVSMQILVDLTSSTAMVVTVYASLVDLEAGATEFRQALATPGAATILSGPPVVAVYEIVMQAAAQR